MSMQLKQLEVSGAAHVNELVGGNATGARLRSWMVHIRAQLAETLITGVTHR